MDIVKASDKQRYALSYTGKERGLGPNAQTLESQNDPNQHLQPQTDPISPSTALALAAYELDQDPAHYMIRATQGHSLKSIHPNANLRKLSLTTSDGKAMELPSTVVHGTYHSTWPLILKEGGLKPMGRLHVHLATGPSLDEVLSDNSGSLGDRPGKSRDSKVISGMRADSQILIYIDLKGALKAGCPFWISENGVVLTEGLEADGTEEKLIPLEFFSAVVERTKGLGMLMENGELVQPTPDWMLAKAQAKSAGARGDRYKK